MTHNKSYSLTAEIEVPESGANGVIVAMGGSVGGWSLYAQDGKLKHCYNFFGIENYFAESKQAIPAGKHQVRMEFKYDGGGLAKGGIVSLYRRRQEGRRRPRRADACRCCSRPTRPAMSARRQARRCHRTTDRTDNAFSGKVNWVQIDLEKDDHDHLITPEERFKVAMARRGGRRIPCTNRSTITQPVTVTADSFVRAETDMYFGNVAVEGGFGKFNHHREPVAIDQQNVIRTNRDTLYSAAVFDLDAGPVTITMPDPGKRFMSMKVVDQDHYVADGRLRAGEQT